MTSSGFILRSALALSAWIGVALCHLACSGPPPELRYYGELSGRVLIAPGVGLARTTVAIESIEMYDHGQVPRGERRGHVVDVMTDENGFYGPVSIGAFAGILRLRTMGGEYRDPISGALIRLDESQGLRALYFMDFFRARANTNVTPVHTFAEARFRYLVSEGQDSLDSLRASYADIGEHFGNLDWQNVNPAEPTAPAASPTEPIRAMAVLGGLAMLTDDLRLSSASTPQVVNLMTLVQAVVEDLESDPLLDGNDANNPAPATGLQIGTCEPTPPGCAVPPGGCQLGACRPRCDTYANTYRGALTAAIRKYLGPKASPSHLNQTGLGSEDARTMLEHIAASALLFGDACPETADRVEPSISWEVSPSDGAAVKGTFTLRVRALDDGEALPSLSFLDYTDEDSAPNTATLTIDTRVVRGGSDGPLTVRVLARDVAGNERRASRTFEIDNTAPLATFDAAAFYIDPVTSVHWTASAAPTLNGTVSDAHARSVELLIGDVVAATATINGMTWSAAVPPGRITSAGAELSIRAEDDAGNVTMTAPVLLRLDATPPAILVESSPVHDEAQSREFYDLDNSSANVWLQRHVVQGAPIDLSQSMEGTCSTVRKYAHLLHEQLPLGVAGALNPLQVSSVVSDDGVGIRPGSVQVRLTVKSGSAMVEALPWTAVNGTPIGGQATRYPVGLFRDGALAIPALATTEGEYLLELRAVDHLGRLTRQARCWNHRILAPRLRATPGEESGKRAEGFSRAMYSTSLNPVGNQVGDFSRKFLNANAEGAAVWAWRFKNYVAHPVFLTVTIPSTVSAQVYRKFEVRESITGLRPATHFCTPGPCDSPSPSSLFASPDPAIPQTQPAVYFRARMFVVTNASTGETGAEILPCTGCANDDATRTYTFQVPARSTPQGTALAEYVILTYLRPTLPAGSGTDALMAPSMVDSNPHAFDTTPGTYSEFIINGVTLTGKLIPPVGNPSYGCVDQEEDGENARWICNMEGRRQRYRALTYARYKLLLPTETRYAISANSDIAPQTLATGSLPAEQANELVTVESTLP